MNSVHAKKFLCVVANKRTLWKSILWFLLFLALLLCIVYWPFSFKLSSLWQAAPTTEPKGTSETKVTVSEGNKTMTTGEQATVAPLQKVKGEKNFFIEYRLERDRNRSQRIEILQEIVDNPNTDDLSRKQAYAELLAISKNLEKEMEVENMIKAKGYKDAIVFINSDTVNVIVQSHSLNSQQAAQIAEVVMRGTGVKPENISLVAKD